MKKMKYVKLFEEFRLNEDVNEELQLITNPAEVEQWLLDNLVGVKDSNGDIRLKPNTYKVDSNGLVDVKANVYMGNMNLDIIPIQFRKISGNFWCNDNNLTSLKGLESLESVGGWFSCSNNNLTSLKGLENLEQVGDNFWCNDNNLTSLKGLDNLESLGRSLWCGNNFLCIEDRDIHKDNPGYNTTDIELIAQRFADKVNGHQNQIEIVKSIAKHKNQDLIEALSKESIIVEIAVKNNITEITSLLSSNVKSTYTEIGKQNRRMPLL